MFEKLTFPIFTSFPSRLEKIIQSTTIFLTITYQSLINLNQSPFHRTQTTDIDGKETFDSVPDIYSSKRNYKLTHILQLGKSRFVTFNMALNPKCPIKTHFKNSKTEIKIIVELHYHLS